MLCSLRFSFTWSFAFLSAFASWQPIQHLSEIAFPSVFLSRGSPGIAGEVYS